MTMLDNILKNWKTTIPGLIVLLLQFLQTFGIEVTPEIKEFAQWLAGLLLLISQDPGAVSNMLKKLADKNLLKHPLNETKNLLNLPNNPFKEKF